MKCRDIHFAHQVHREKAPTMAYQYLWGSKALNIANNTVYSQVTSLYFKFPAILFSKSVERRTGFQLWK